MHSEQQKLYSKHQSMSQIQEKKKKKKKKKKKTEQCLEGNDLKENGTLIMLVGTGCSIFGRAHRSLTVGFLLL